jgi:hypothetical protein
MCQWLDAVSGVGANGTILLGVPCGATCHWLTHRPSMSRTNVRDSLQSRGQSPPTFLAKTPTPEPS